MSINILTQDDLLSHDAAISDLDTRVASLESQPPSGSGGPVLIADLEANDSPHIGIGIPAVYDRLLLKCSYVTANIQPGSALTVYLSNNGGVSYDDGPNYNNAGQSNWIGEPNQAFWPQPWPISEPQRLNLGCRIGIDAGERDYLGAHCNAEFTAMGAVSGIPVAPVYRCDGYMGFIGGEAGNSMKPAWMGGDPWFPGDPVGSPFDWAAQYSYAGHWKSPGSRITAMLINMNGGATYGRRIKTGRFQLWGLS